MSLASQRLDSFLAKHCGISKRDVRLMLAQKRVLVDGQLAANIEQQVNKFSLIALDEEVIQNNPAYYVMLHKPIGVVCATKDVKHSTVIDLLPYDFKEQLHIVGRLDLNTSGLVLLTNDSRWSEAIIQPSQKIEKTYQVTLQTPIDESYVDAFAQGMYFGYENITTLPAKLKILDTHVAEVKLLEGKYHQIKRMFGRFRNPVIALHRSQIGDLVLDTELSSGQSRLLTDSEVCLFTK
ncbi:MAG: 16S rRNA pseudouridine(516) synthase [Colwelliaceae bacterium]|nr:16S rRNA pseudouridine(516) synthase [Colwelliaceae bacterium]